MADGHEAHEKMQEMQIKTTMRYYLTPVRTGHHQTINAGEGMERRETFYTVAGNVNC